MAIPFWVHVGGGLALAVHPVDDNVNEAMINSDFAHDFFKFGSVLGQLYTLLPGAVTVYTIGRAKDKPKISHLGMDLIESLAISGAIVLPLKYTTRRERPDGSRKPSFPSGHAADTFAFATALERHLGWKGAVPAYIFSSYVAITRLPDNRHSLSDVVFWFQHGYHRRANGHTARAGVSGHFTARSPAGRSQSDLNCQFVIASAGWATC